MSSNARNYLPSTPTVTTTWTEFLPVNAGRGPLILTNTGSTDILFGPLDYESAAITIPVGKGVSFLEEEAPLSALGCKVSIGTGAMTVWEG